MESNVSHQSDRNDGVEGLTHCTHIQTVMEQLWGSQLTKYNETKYLISILKVLYLGSHIKMWSKALNIFIKNESLFSCNEL